MPRLNIEIYVYDPALPFQLHKLDSVGVDTWHEYALLNRKVLEKLKYLKPEKDGVLKLSGGMRMSVPIIEIGLQIGNIKMDNVEALVVDEGSYDVLLGEQAINKIFKIGTPQQKETESKGFLIPSTITSKQKDDPDALSLELYPIKKPFDVRYLENFLRLQRRLYNILLIASGEIEVEDETQLSSIIDDDKMIPEDLRLKVSWIDSGSIWVSLTSGSERVLQLLSTLFEVSATAELEYLKFRTEKQVTGRVEVSQNTRENTLLSILEEQEKLSEEEIENTYNNWRKSVMKRLEFFEELIAQVDREDIRRQLIERKDKAIFEIVHQQLFPVVKNIPHGDGLSPYPPDPQSPPPPIVYLPATASGGEDVTEI